MFVLFLALRLACFLSLPRDRARKLQKHARETYETLQLQTPGERAQRASKGCTRPTTLAILMLALLSPRWLGCASWCFALVLLAVVCASLLVFSVACDACGSRFSRASRSSLVRFGNVSAPGPPAFEKWESCLSFRQALRLLLIVQLIPALIRAYPRSQTVSLCKYLCLSSWPFKRV